MRYILVLLLLLPVLMVNSQIAPVVNLSFNNCTVSNDGTFPDPIIEGNTICDCGVSGDSQFLSGSSSAITFDTIYTSLFQDDFTLSFYFMINENATGIIDILSVSESCQVDSSLTIKYIPEESLIRVQMAKDFELFVELKGTINKDHCWHQLVFQRNDKNYSLFIDGEFAASDFTNGQIVLSPSATMKISKSPCQSFGENPFRGLIDEFKIYNFILPVENVISDFIKVDQILTMDTTIFSGSSVFISQTQSCADEIRWSPQATVNSSNELEPEISPNSSTQYFVVYDYAICTAIDSINIAVIDQELIKCEDLLLPNAFTPNNDGTNDVFGISNGFIIEELKTFEIYDRWGSQVFSTSLKTESWNGQFKGQKVNPNVYLFKVNYVCGNEEFVKTGSFSVLR